LKLLADRFGSDIIQPIVEATADFAFNQMYGNAPWRTGYLAMSIVKQVSEGSASIKPLAPYAIYVEKGTRPHEIYPVNARCLAFASGMLGGMVFTMHVHHPGTQPNPFVQTTAVETRDESGRIALRVLDEVMGNATEG
jgi:hypothetical protein